MSPELQIKLMSLAAESQIIRRKRAQWLARARRANTEEKRTRALNTFDSLHFHRVNIVRKECRLSHLAYGFLRGMDYKRMERTCHEKPNFEKVLNIVLRFSKEDSRIVKQRFEQWSS